MDVAKAGQIVAIMLLPSLSVAAVLYLPRGVDAWRQRRANRRAESAPPPGRQPIERLAADLRRLLRLHDTLMRSDAAMRVGHLRAVEAAITECAVDAAYALDVPCPPRPERGAFSTPELRRILRALADAGLVLPPGVALLTADPR